MKMEEQMRRQALWEDSWPELLGIASRAVPTEAGQGDDDGK